MRRFLSAAAALIAVIIPLCGCGAVEENCCHEVCEDVAEVSETDETALSEPPDIKPGVPSADTASAAPSEKQAVAESEGNSDADILSFEVDNVYADGKYYSVSVVGEKRGGALGDFRLVLSESGAELDSLGIVVPDGDRFIIMDSVAEGLSYGCGVISNMRDFAADDYPDIVQLDFYDESELEVPQYGRFFSIFDGKLAELAVFENGVETKPLGTHLKLLGAGRMVQNLCVYTPSGKSLMMERYEYIFDIERRRLNKREVEFLGWNADN